MKINKLVGLVVVAALTSGILTGVAVSAFVNPPPPRIEGHGSVTRFPDAPEQPRDGSKILVDVTAGGPADEINPALEKVARFVNIYSQAGKKPAHAKICVVLHGDATGTALNDKAYAEAFSTKGNPNLPLMKLLNDAGVELLACGQAMTKKGYDPADANPQVRVAVSGLTAMVNRQEEGYAYIPLK